MFEYFFECVVNDGLLPLSTQAPLMGLGINNQHIYMIDIFMILIDGIFNDYSDYFHINFWTLFFGRRIGFFFEKWENERWLIDGRWWDRFSI